MKKLFFFWNKLRATFWFLPSLIILLSILFAVVFVYIDQTVNLSTKGIARNFFVSNVDSARTILSTISGAMIGVAGTVFSVTLVALTLASSQLGPRLIRKFMYVRLNQVVLGTYISTYLYCLIVLNSVRDFNDYTFIPSISILVAILAAVINIVLLIVFIHQIAVSIQADEVVSDVSKVLSKQVRVLFPETTKEFDSHKKLNIEAIKFNYANVISIKSTKNGYLQYIDNEALIEKMTKIDALFELIYRPGDYFIDGLEIGKLYTKQKIDEEKIDEIFSQFVIGKTKNSQQDLEFSINQMVEIAVRALSPGINDPFTAITCIDNLSATMCYLAQINFPSKYHFNQENELRIITNNVDFEGLLNASFNQIRQNAAGSPAVLIRLMEVLVVIHQFAKKEKYKQAIEKHIKMVLNLGKHSIQEKNDLEDLINRANKYI